MPLSSSEEAESISAGRNLALALRLKLGLNYAPIAGPHLWKVIRDHAIDLAFNNFGDSGGDGLYLWDGTRGLIVLNDAKPTLRVRFTAAHELCHHLLHRFDMEQEKLFPDLDIDDDRHLAQERAANAFAAEFLAPDDALAREVAHVPSRMIDGIAVVRLMRTYGVMYEFVLWRLEQIGALRDTDRARLLEQRHEQEAIKAIIGFDERELFGAPKHRLPEEFVLNAMRLRDDDVITQDRLQELLRENGDEVVHRFSPSLLSAPRGVHASPS